MLQELGPLQSAHNACRHDTDQDARTPVVAPGHPTPCIFYDLISWYWDTSYPRGKERSATARRRDYGVLKGDDFAETVRDDPFRTLSSGAMGKLNPR
jgi:hypothetical protein